MPVSQTGSAVVNGRLYPELTVSWSGVGGSGSGVIVVTININGTQVYHNNGSSSGTVVLSPATVASAAPAPAVTADVTGSAAWTGSNASNQGFSGSFAIIDPPPNPGSVLNLQVADAGASATVTWDAPAGGTPTGYEFSRNGVVLFNQAGTSPRTYTDTTAGGGAPITYSVRAYNTNSAFTTYGSSASATDPLPATPAAVSNLNAVDTTSNVAVTWGAPAGGVTGYEVSRQKVTDGGPVVVSSNQSAASYTDTSPGVLRPVTYSVRGFRSNLAGTVYGPSTSVSVVALPDSVGVLQG